MARVVTDVYEFEEILGEGAFSSVVLATKNDSKKQYAIKLIDKSKIIDEIQRQRVDREIAILKTCNHPNIVKLVDVFESDDEISMVMELMHGGDLFDRIASKGVFTEEEARDAMYSIISAVDYLHDRSLVHRDIKPENLLYSMKDGHSLLKLSDFGLSKQSNDAEGLETPCGTIAYTAPEITHNKLYRKGVDIWSCGCILYFMLFGRPPFYSDSEEEIYEMVSEGSWVYPDKPFVSDAAKELIGYMLEKDPGRRLTAKQALTHPWVMKQSQRPILPTTPPPASISAPMAIPNFRISFNSAIEAQRGPLTPPLESPLESPLWKKRANKAKKFEAPQSPVPKPIQEEELSSDGDDVNAADDTDDGMEIDMMAVLS